MKALFAIITLPFLAIGVLYASIKKTLGIFLRNEKPVNDYYRDF